MRHVAFLLASFALGCGSSSSPGTDAGIVCEDDETLEALCTDLVPEALGGPSCCGDVGAYGCTRGGDVRCPEGFIPTGSCTGFWLSADRCGTAE